MNPIGLICGVALAALMGSAHAAVITFDDDGIPLSKQTDRVIRDGVVYGGFAWSNFVYYDTRDGNFQAGLKSGNNVGFNLYGDPASFSSPTAFTVNSLWATAGWRSGMDVTFLGYGSTGAVVYSKTIQPSATEATLYAFDWVGLYKFGFSASGGTRIGEPDGRQVILDDITVNQAVNSAVTNPGTDPVTNPDPDPVTDPVTDPGTDPVIDPDPQSPPLVIDLPLDPPVSDPVGVPPTPQSSDVPSPATLMLLGVGLLGLGASRYKKTERRAHCAPCR